MRDGNSVPHLFINILFLCLPQQPLQHLHIFFKLLPAKCRQNTTCLGFPVHECLTDGYVPGLFQLLKLSAQIPVRSLRDVFQFSEILLPGQQRRQNRQSQLRLESLRYRIYFHKLPRSVLRSNTAVFMTSLLPVKIYPQQNHPHTHQALDSYLTGRNPRPHAAPSSNRRILPALITARYRISLMLYFIHLFLILYNIEFSI